MKGWIPVGGAALLSAVATGFIQYRHAAALRPLPTALSALDSARWEEPAKATPAAPPSATVSPAEAFRDAVAAASERTLSSERVDIAYAQAVPGELKRALASLPGWSFERALCTADVCRINLVFADEKSRLRFIESMPTLLPQVFPSVVFASPYDGTHMIMYGQRPGRLFPVAKSETSDPRAVEARP